MADYRVNKNKKEAPQAQAQVGNVDMEALANLIADKVVKNVEVPQNSGIINKGFSGPKRDYVDDFDDSSALNQLAESMTVQRGDQSSNFDDLGGVKETKKDNNQTNNTIDLLADLED